MIKLIMKTLFLFISSLMILLILLLTCGFFDTATNLTNYNSGNEMGPYWSSDGTRITFISDRDGNNEIYVMDADGSNQTNLTNNDVWDDFPNWSPDGTKIVFSSARDGNIEIYVMDVE